MSTRVCGYKGTTTGEPCGHLVRAVEGHCAAGHPCPPLALAGAPVGEGAPASSGAPYDLDRMIDELLGIEASPLGQDPPAFTRAPRPPVRLVRVSGSLSRAQQATDLDNDALMADESELTIDVGLDDPEVVEGAIAELGTQRLALAQRFGRVGSFLALGYGERRARRVAGGPLDPGDAEASCLEHLVEGFSAMSAGQLAAHLAILDTTPSRADDECSRAARWMAATYAVKVRDDTAKAHDAYGTAYLQYVRLSKRPKAA